MDVTDRKKEEHEGRVRESRGGRTVVDGHLIDVDLGTESETKTSLELTPGVLSKHTVVPCTSDCKKFRVRPITHLFSYTVLLRTFRHSLGTSPRHSPRPPAVTRPPSLLSLCLSPTSVSPPRTEGFLGLRALRSSPPYLRSEPSADRSPWSERFKVGSSGRTDTSGQRFPNKNLSTHK